MNHSVLVKERFLTKEELFELIEVREPYFALHHIRLIDEVTIEARVVVEQPLNNEIGPISAAEAGRHLAILGSCIAALNNPVKRKHYYLASEANYKRMDGDAIGSSFLVVRATLQSIDKRQATVSAEVRNAFGETLITLDVSYHILSETLFERMNGHAYIANPLDLFENPYALGFEQKVTGCSENTANAYIQVPEYLCTGHFPNYPAMPIAIMSANLIGLCIHLTNRLTGNDDRYLVTCCRMKAENLAFANNTIEMQASHILSNGNSHVVRSYATCKGKNVGYIEVELQAE